MWPLCGLAQVIAAGICIDSCKLKKTLLSSEVFHSYGRSTVDCKHSVKKTFEPLELAIVEIPDVVHLRPGHTGEQEFVFPQLLVGQLRMCPAA